MEAHPGPSTSGVKPQNKYERPIVPDPVNPTVEFLSEKDLHIIALQFRELKSSYENGGTFPKLAPCPISVTFKAGRNRQKREDAMAMSANPVDSIISSSHPNLSRKIFSIEHTSPSLPISRFDSVKILYPVNRVASAHVIQRFFNGKTDVTMGVFINRDYLSSEVTTEMATLCYFLSCIQYITSIDMAVILGEVEGATPVTGWKQLIDFDKRTQVEEYAHHVDITLELLCFLALYGLYALCRAVDSKQDLNAWCARRYNALIASIRTQSDPNISINWSTCGSYLNRMASLRPEVRQIAYQLVAEKSPISGDIHSLSVQAQAKMLVAYSEMTTYEFINRVIAHGGPVVGLAAIAKQIVAYAYERQKVIDNLKERGYDETDLPYVHLIFSGYQCFTAATYSDLIIAANALEQSINPKNRRSLERYKAKITNATVDKSVLIAMYKQSSSTMSVGSLSAPEQEELKKLGLDYTELQASAKRTMKTLSRRRDADLLDDGIGSDGED